MASFIAAIVAIVWETTLWTRTQSLRAVEHFVNVARHIRFKKWLSLPAPPASNATEHVFLFNTSYFDSVVLTPMCPKVTTTDISIWTGSPLNDFTSFEDVFVDLYQLLQLTAHLWLPYIVFLLVLTTTMCVSSIINLTQLRNRHNADLANSVAKVNCLKMIIRTMGKGKKKSLRLALEEASDQSLATGRRVRKLSKASRIQAEAYRVSIHFLSKKLRNATSNLACQDVTISRLAALIEKLEAEKQLIEHKTTELENLGLQKGHELDSMMHELASQKVQILNLEVQVTQQLAKFSSDNTKISKLNVAIERLHSAGRDKDATIAELRGAILQKDQIIGTLENSLAETESTLALVPEPQTLSLSLTTHVAISPVQAVQKLGLMPTHTSFELLPCTSASR